MGSPSTVKCFSSRCQPRGLNRVITHTLVSNETIRGDIPDNEGRQMTVCTKLVVLVIEFEVYLSAYSIVQVDLPIYHIVPCRRV